MRFFTVVILVCLSAAPSWAAYSPEILGAACQYSLEHQKIPWACYHPRVAKIPRGWTRERLARQCIRAAKDAGNIENLDQIALNYLPVKCMAQAKETLKLIEYKKDDL